MAATGDEIAAALEALPTTEQLRLRSYAQWRIAGLGRAARGRSYEDLLHEAYLAALGGRRRWDPAAVPFLGFLLGALKSISSHWRESFSEDEAQLDCEVHPDPAQDGPIQRAESVQPDAERILAARSQLQAVMKLFEDDPEVLCIIDGLGDGMTGPEIQAALDLTPKEYEAALRRMRRRTKPVFGQGGRGNA